MKFKIGDYVEGLGIILTLNPMCVIHEHLSSYGKIELNEDDMLNGEYKLILEEQSIQHFLIKSFNRIQKTIDDTKKASIMLEDTYEKTKIKKSPIKHKELVVGDIERNSIIVDISEDTMFGGKMGNKKYTMIQDYDVGDVICGVTYTYNNVDDFEVKIYNTSEKNIKETYNQIRINLNLTIKNLKETQALINNHIKLEQIE